MAPSPTSQLLFGLALSLAVFGCGGVAEDHAPALGEPDVADADGQIARPAGLPSSHALREGLLQVSTAGSVQSYLTSLHAVVANAEGVVVAGAEQGMDAPRAADAPELALLVPEGEGYELRLVASAEDDSATCRASVGPLRVEADAIADVQVLAWDCGGATGYVPTEPDAECFWLAEWSFVSRTSAEVGEDIRVAASGHEPDGKSARFAWTTSAPALGRFADPKAASTSFRCQAAGQALSLDLAVTDGACRRQLSHRISCL